MEQMVVFILTKAVSLDKSSRFTESLAFYQEGLELLIGIWKSLPPGGKKDAMKQKIESYIGRAEKIKEIIKAKKKQGIYHEEIEISENSSGYSYEEIMGRYMDSKVDSIEITDPYIKTFNQFCNLLQFCEVAVRKCINLKDIKLITSSAQNTSVEPVEWFKNLADDLQTNHKINFQVEYSTTLHDREILFSNGWVIKIGRGLDYFKSPTTKYGLGKFDFSFRLCRATKIDIYYKGNTL